MNWTRNTYYLSVALFTVGVCCSKFLMSMGLLTGGIYFVFLGNFKEKIQNLIRNPFALILISFYLLHVVGLIWSNDLTEGLNDIRQKSTLVIIPFIILSSKEYASNSYRLVKILFLTTLFLTSIINIVGYNLFFEELDLKETRNMSLFIGHIRYSLLISLGAVWALYEFIKKEKFYFTFLILFCWFTFYTLQSEVLSGIFGLLLGSITILLWYLISLKKWLWLISTVGVFLIGTIGVLFYLSIPVENPKDLIEINSKTEKSWNSKSNIPLNKLDKRQQPIQYTLNRYLFSLNLPLNESGINDLSTNDVYNIENGIADVRETQWSIFSRLFKIRYELHSETNPNLHPIIERIELWNNAWYTIKKNWILGIGNGGVKDALNKSYAERHSPLELERRLRPHNMFLTYWLTFGLFGILFLIFIISYFAFSLLKRNNILGLVFILIAASSFISEDTLESQAGITFFTFFFCFFSNFNFIKAFSSK